MAMSKESAMSREMRATMHNYRITGKLTDVVIVTADKDIPAHKVVLCSVPWQITTWINKPKLELRDYKGADIEKIIDFIYTENIDISQTSDAIKFSEISKKLGLKYLEDLTIENLMKKSKNIDDCLEIWRFAKNEKFQKLQKSCEQFIWSDYINFMNKSIKTLSEKEMKLLLNKSELTDFEKYEIIKKWGELVNSKDRKYQVQELFENYVTWSNIKNEHFPKISLDPYMLRNFQNIIVEELINDRLGEANSN